VSPLKNEIYRLTYELEQSYWWYVARRRIVMAQVEDILKSREYSVSGRPRLLDYGCGTGLNLVYLAELGDAYGVDISAMAIDFCRKRGIKDVTRIDAEYELDKSNPFGDSFDVVTMLDVLEHIPDDEFALKSMSKWLRPGGILLVTVPAHEFLWSGEDYVSGHRRRYSRRSLIQVFHKAGYKVLKLTYLNFFLFPLQVAAILWNRMLNPRSMYATSLVPLPQGVNSVLASIMSLEARLTRKCSLPIGGSILCYGRVAVQAPGTPG
jgi:SAM-dependent methyltransferase